MYSQHYFCLVDRILVNTSTTQGNNKVMQLHEAVAKRIQEYCSERKITPNKLCTMSGVIQSTVNSIFSGRSKNPKLATIEFLCQGLGITLKEFFDSPLFDNIIND